MTKHTPATPLPWKPSPEDGKPQDADYLVHAANSYPRLVEVLRLTADGEHSAFTAARALLRELGEE